MEKYKITYISDGGFYPTNHPLATNIPLLFGPNPYSHSAKFLSSLDSFACTSEHVSDGGMNMIQISLGGEIIHYRVKY